MNGATATVESSAGRFGGDHRSWLAGIDGCAGDGITPDVMIATAHGPAALVVMIMTAQDEVDGVSVEQWQPGLPYALVGPVAVEGGTERVLMHLHDDPVDALIAPRGAQGRLEPAGLLTATVAMNVDRGARCDRRVTRAQNRRERLWAGYEGTAVLVDHIIGRERDEHHRTDLEVVPAAREFRAIVRERVAGQIGIQSLCAIAEFDFMVPGTGHPGPVGSRSLHVLPEVSPHRGLGQRILVRVAQIAVKEMKQGVKTLDHVDRVMALWR